MPTKRYATATGSDPAITGCMHMSGPQAADQVFPEIQLLLDRPGVTEVAVMYDHGGGPRVATFKRIED